MGLVARVKTWVAEQLSQSDLNAEFDNLISGVNNITTAQITAKAVTDVKLDDSINPAIRDGEMFNSEYVESGLTYDSAAALIATFLTGIAYILKTSGTFIELKRVYMDRNWTATLAANSDNYVDLKHDKTVSVVAVSVGATEPPVTTDAIRIWKLTTNSSTVTSNTDKRNTSFLTTFSPKHIIGDRYIRNNAASPTTKVDVERCTARDSTGAYSFFVSTITIDITVSGANGLDTGSEAGSTWYYIYLIGDTSGTNAVKAVFSTSASSPTLPSGYDVFARVGAVRNDGSSNFLEFRQEGNFVCYMNENNVYNTTPPGTSFVTVGCSGFAPTNSRMGFFTFLQNTISAGLADPTIVCAPGDKTGSSGGLLALTPIDASIPRINSLPCALASNQEIAIRCKTAGATGNLVVQVLGFYLPE